MDTAVDPGAGAPSRDDGTGRTRGALAAARACGHLVAPRALAALVPALLLLLPALAMAGTPLRDRLTVGAVVAAALLLGAAVSAVRQLLREREAVGVAGEQHLPAAWARLRAPVAEGAPETGAGTTPPAVARASRLVVEQRRADARRRLVPWRTVLLSLGAVIAVWLVVSALLQQELAVLITWPVIVAGWVLADRLTHGRQLRALERRAP